MLTDPPGNRLHSWRFRGQDGQLTDQQWAALWAWVALQPIVPDDVPFNGLIVVVGALLSAGMDPTDILPVLEDQACAAANFFLDRLAESRADP